LRNCRLKTARLPISPQAQAKLKNLLTRSAVAFGGAKIGNSTGFAQTRGGNFNLGSPFQTGENLFVSYLRCRFFFEEAV